MTILYGRRIEVTVAGLVITDLRISVELERMVDKTQARGKIDIYNLNDEHEQRIYDRGGPVTVSAGYPQTVAEIYSGDTQRIVRARERLARITSISVGDLVRSKERLGGVTARSYDGAVTVRMIAQDLATDIGIPLGPLDAIPPPATFQDFYWTGQADGGLTVLLKSVNCQWYESDGLIRINRVGMVQPDAPRISISPETGLVDTPIETDEGAEARMLLNPALQLGGILDIESATLTGSWKIVGLRHNADNWSGKFVSWCDLRAITG